MGRLMYPILAHDLWPLGNTRSFLHSIDNAFHVDVTSSVIYFYCRVIRRTKRGTFVPLGVRRRQQQGNDNEQQIAPVVIKDGQALPPGTQGVFVRRSGIDGAGLGLFGGSDFKSGDRITEYCGKLKHFNSDVGGRTDTHVLSTRWGENDYRGFAEASDRARRGIICELLQWTSNVHTQRGPTGYWMPCIFASD